MPSASCVVPRTPRHTHPKYNDFVSRAVVRSLAKINLDLRVLHKRSDGFHELRTVFQTISLADTIAIEFERTRQTRITIESAVDIPDNLLAKAAGLLLNAMKISARVHFTLSKRIPMGGGLGGGSSNAAAVLLALPPLAGRQLRLETLLELGSQLGSDVPFFLLGGTAVAIGRGTELYPLPDLAPRSAILACPGVHVSTPQAYADLERGELTGQQSFRNIGNFQSLAWRVGDDGTGQPWDAANDFETVVFNRYPHLKSIKGKLLKLGARPALMSGSGSSIFGIFDSRPQRDLALKSLNNGRTAGELHPVSLVTRRRYRALWQRQLGTESTLWPPQHRSGR